MQKYHDKKLIFNVFKKKPTGYVTPKLKLTYNVLLDFILNSIVSTIFRLIFVTIFNDSAYFYVIIKR